MNFEAVQPFTGFKKSLPVQGQESAAAPVHGADIIGSGLTLQQVRTAYHTAVSVQRPRVLDSVVRAVMTEVEYAGREAYYRWPVQNRDGTKSVVEGGTIGLGLIIAREWTNCAIESEFREENGYWVFDAAFIDLERGFTVRRQYRKRIPVASKGRFDLERTEDMEFQIGQSKAIRNAIRGGTPAWLWKKAIARAKEVVRTGISKEGIENSVKKAIAELKSYGVTVEQIRNHLGRDLNSLGMDDVETLVSLVVQVENGEVDPQKIGIAVDSPSQTGPGPAADTVQAPHGNPMAPAAPETAPGRKSAHEEAREVRDMLEASAKFSELAERSGIAGDRSLEEYLRLTAEQNNLTVARVRAEVVRDFERFREAFEEWRRQRAAAAAAQKGPSVAAAAVREAGTRPARAGARQPAGAPGGRRSATSETPVGGPVSEASPDWCPKEPHDPTYRPSPSACSSCAERPGCPAWADTDSHLRTEAVS